MRKISNNIPTCVEVKKLFWKSASKKKHGPLRLEAKQLKGSYLKPMLLKTMDFYFFGKYAFV